MLSNFLMETIRHLAYPCPEQTEDDMRHRNVRCLSILSRIFELC